MRKLLFLCLCLLCFSCTTEPTIKTTQVNQVLTSKENHPPNLENLRIGMSRVDAEGILGEPTSITDTATGTTVVWIFAPGSTQASPPSSPKSNSGFFSQIGGIGARVVGIFSPIAGTVMGLGSQVYSVINPGKENTTQPVLNGTAETRIVTIEFRDNKIFSIQRARPMGLPTSTDR